MHVPSRRTAICLQWCGMAVAFAALLLSVTVGVSQTMMAVYLVVAIAFLGSGVLIRRHHDGD